VSECRELRNTDQVATSSLRRIKQSGGSIRL